jgi:hypothetical protein
MKKQTAIDWIRKELEYFREFEQFYSNNYMHIDALFNEAKEIQNNEKLKYQLFIGKVMEIIGYETTIELLKECNETFKSE